jgi:SAM-dependent methyltransferase
MDAVAGQNISMVGAKLHHQIPIFGRPFLQRNEARLQRDEARRERDEARRELCDARGELENTRQEKDDARGELENVRQERSARLTRLETNVGRLLKYGTPYASTGPVLPPVGIPADFIDETYVSSWLREERHDWWRGQDLALAALMRRDPAPLPEWSNREGYCCDNNLAYWLSGYRDYRKTLAVLPDGLVGGRYFDFGGSTGRVFRHFAFQSDAWNVWSSDFKINSVEWNLRHFPTTIKTLLNNSSPTLPLPDGYFDLVTAFSVFTHINEPEIAWLLELRRILKVGGIACISVHDEATWKNQPPGLRDAILRDRPEIADLPALPDQKTVVTWREDDPYNCNVFHAREHIEQVWGRFFEICAVRPLYLDQQAAVVCRRPD